MSGEVNTVGGIVCRKSEIGGGGVCVYVARVK